MINHKTKLYITTQIQANNILTEKRLAKRFKLTVFYKIAIVRIFEGDGTVRLYRRRNRRYAYCCVHGRDRFRGGGSVLLWEVNLDSSARRTLFHCCLSQHWCVRAQLTFYKPKSLHLSVLCANHAGQSFMLKLVIPGIILGFR